METQDLETPLENVENEDVKFFSENTEESENMEQNEVIPEILPTDGEFADSDLQVEEKISEDESAIQESLETGSEYCPDIVERLITIEEELKRNNKLVESKFLYDSAKEEMINRLHKELQVYKDDFYKKLLKPLIMDMIVFADSMRSLISRYEETPEAETLLEKYQKLRKEFMKVGSHIDDVVFNYGVEPFTSVQGDEFNPRTQQAKKNTVTENPDEHKRIISSLSSGYTWDEQMLRRESVHVSICEQVEINK